MSVEGDRPSRDRSATAPDRQDGRGKAATLAAQLATGTWTHDYHISAEEAREMGLPVRTDMPRKYSS